MSKNKYRLIRCIVFPAVFIIVNSSAQTTIEEEERAFYRDKGYIPISGSQTGSYEGKHYVVMDDIVVEEGKLMKLNAGASLFFKEERKIIVKGKLVLAGNSESTISLMKLPNDKYYFPLKEGLETRWEGIEVLKSGSIELSYTSIADSKNGIIVRNQSSKVILDNVLFTDTKYNRLMIGEEVIEIKEDNYCSYNSLIRDKAKVSAKSLKRKREINRGKLLASFGLGALAVAGGALSVYFHYEAEEYEKKYEEGTVTAKVDRYYKKGNQRYDLRNAFAVICGLGAIGFTVTIFF